jgi:predicted AAA+ superfamily ATPase
LNLLTDAGLLGGLEKYSGSMVNQRSSSPKFQVYNNALMTVQKNESFATATTNLNVWGRYVESAIGAHLINHKIKENYKLNYWREGNDEVDFVLEKGDTTIALEVKSGRTQKNAGMNVFIKKYPQAKPLLTGNSGISCEEFLKINPAELF